MERSDRSFLLLAAVALPLAFLAALPLAITLFPGAIQRALHGYEGLLHACAAALQLIGGQLPPLGLPVLALAFAAVAASGRGVVSSLARTRAFLRSRRPAITPLVLRRAASVLGLGDRVVCFADPAPLAFTAGLIRPTIWISTGALRRLGRRELVAVLAHEAHHLRRRDPLRILIAGAVASLLFPFPIVQRLRQRFEVAKELAADRAALLAIDRPSLAGALLALDPLPARSVAIGAWSLAGTRIDHLEGVPPQRLLPPVRARTVLITAVAALALCAATAGQVVRANLVPAAAAELFLGPTAGDVRECPLPPEGPLL